MKRQVSESMSGNLLATKAASQQTGASFCLLVQFEQAEVMDDKLHLRQNRVKNKIDGTLLNNYLNKFSGLRFVHTEKRHQKESRGHKGILLFLPD